MCSMHIYECIEERGCSGYKVSRLHVAYHKHDNTVTFPRRNYSVETAETDKNSDTVQHVRTHHSVSGTAIT